MISVPYVVYARILPERARGRRLEYVRDMEKIAVQTKMDLDDVGGFVLAESQIASTPQFGNFPARLTIVGFDNIPEENFQPATKRTVDAPGTEPASTGVLYTPPQNRRSKDGYEGTQILHPQGQQLDPRTRAYMLALKTDLESASPWLAEIYRIDYMGVIFGQGGYSCQ